MLCDNIQAVSRFLLIYRLYQEFLKPSVHTGYVFKRTAPSSGEIRRQKMHILYSTVAMNKGTALLMRLCFILVSEMHATFSALFRNTTCTALANLKAFS
jgi:hypothetical protein